MSNIHGPSLLNSLCLFIISQKGILLPEKIKNIYKKIVCALEGGMGVIFSFRVEDDILK
jgi:hypothetical protein